MHENHYQSKTIFLAQKNYIGIYISRYEDKRVQKINRFVIHNKKSLVRNISKKQLELPLVNLEDSEQSNIRLSN